MRRKKSPRRRRRTLPQLKRECWGLLSQVVRRSAADAGGMVRCYTCGLWMPWKGSQAGHFVPGRTGSVLLNQEVVRVQCYRCNVLLRGNYQVFTLRMIDEVGRGKVEELLALKHRVRKWSRLELEEMRGWLRLELEQLDEREKQKSPEARAPQG